MEYRLKVIYEQEIASSKFTESFECTNFEDEETLIAFAELCKDHVKNFNKAEWHSSGTITAEE